MDNIEITEPRLALSRIAALLKNEPKRFRDVSGQEWTGFSDSHRGSWRRIRRSRQ